MGDVEAQRLAAARYKGASARAAFVAGWEARQQLGVRVIQLAHGDTPGATAERRRAAIREAYPRG